MRIGRSSSTTGTTQVVVLTADAGFAEQARATFGASDQISLKLVAGTLGPAKTPSTSRARPSRSSTSTLAKPTK
jgi:hypothetical protein